MATGTREHPLSLVQFPFSTGIDEGTRDEVVEAGAAWAVLENGRQDHVGGYSTRNGYTALQTTRTDGTTPTVGYRHFADGNAIARITDGPQIETWDTKGLRWKQLGRISEVTQRLIDVPTIIDGGTFGASITDLCYCNGYFAIAWSGPIGAPLFAPFATVTHAATGVTVRAPEQVGAGTSTTSAPLLATYGVYIIAVWASGASSIAARYLDTTTSTSIALGWQGITGTNVATDGDGGGGNTSFVLQSLSDRIAIFYANNSGAGTDRGTCKTFTISGVLQTQTINTSSLNVNRLAICGSSSDTLWLAWAESPAGTTVCVRGLNPSTITSTLASKATILTMVGGAGAIGFAADATTAGAARLVANDTTGTQLRMRSVVTTAGAAVASGTEVRVPAANITQRPWQYAGRYYVTVTADATQKTVTVVDWSDSVTYLRPVCVFAPGLTVATPSSIGQDIFRTCVVGPTATKLYLLAQITKSGAADATSLLELDYASIYRWQSCAHGNSTFLPGGVLTAFDGVRAAEVGIIYRPTTPTTTTSSTGITASTGWRYIAVYEEVDADGNWTISGLSNPSVSTGAVANKLVSVVTQPLTITSRIQGLPGNLGGVRIAIYRTLDGGVAPYYRVGTAANDTTSLTVTFPDNISDTVLAANAKLYAQPGVLSTAQDRRVPPGLNCIVSYNGMLVGATGSDVWFSGQNVSGEGTWFNPIFSIPVPGAGDITALVVMDGTLFVFKRRDVYAVAGDAPSDNGSSGGLGQPRRLAADVGSVGPVTCVTALGIVFQSDRGIEVLTRAQTVEWFGQPVQDTQLAFPIVTAITVEPISCTILVECAASSSAGVASGNGRTLVFDLSLKLWVAVDRRTTVAGVASSPAQSGCLAFTTANVAAGEYRYTWMSPTGSVHVESNSYVEADLSLVCKRAVSAHVKAAGLQGSQAINKTLLLAKYATPHNLSMSFAYDYATSYQTPRIYTDAQLAVLVAAIPNMQLEHQMHEDSSPCEAVRVQLQDVTPTSGNIGTGQGSTWIALAFETVPYADAYGLPDASR